jgi:8-oxo-dGTP pyrophosphatase MutT (NUDIX family)
MSEPLEAYLNSYPAHHETIERWPIQGDLKVRLSLSSALPPPDVSSSILAIVVNDDRQILFLHPSNATGSIAHVLIGGRPEAGETPQQTAIREVGEETGWRIRPTRMIGFRHFHHLEPFRPQSDRPYPDFIQPIFAAMALFFDATLVLDADRIPCEFVDFESAERLIEPMQRPLLQAAMKAIRDR